MNRGTSQSVAIRIRALPDAAFDKLIRLRHKSQFAAGTTWHGDLNIGTRREFLLPAGRPFTG